MRPTYNPPLERTAAAVYFTCGRASRGRRRGRSTAFRYPAMAISDFHASTIVKVRAYFGFDNFACDPDAITRFIGIQPDELGRKGSVKTVRGGREIRRPF